MGKNTTRSRKDEKGDDDDSDFAPSIPIPTRRNPKRKRAEKGQELLKELSPILCSDAGASIEEAAENNTQADNNNTSQTTVEKPQRKQHASIEEEGRAAAAENDTQPDNPSQSTAEKPQRKRRRLKDRKKHLLTHEDGLSPLSKVNQVLQADDT